MKRLVIFCCLLLVLLQGCGLREREESLQEKESALNEREQQLLLKEKSLQLKEEALLNKQKALDSSIVSDTTAKFYAELVGTWNVQMTCTETTCQGSAVGDTKTETWEISYQEMNVIAKAKVNDELVRVYSGIYTGSTLELAEATETPVQSPTKMTVRLTVTTDTRLEGHREIERLNEKCKIVYEMTMNKK